MTAPSWPADTCGCGLPLHYIDLAAKEYVTTQVAERGVMVQIIVGNERYWVPRHFIALHGVAAMDLADLVTRYGWPQS